MILLNYFVGIVIIGVVVGVLVIVLNNVGVAVGGGGGVVVVIVFNVGIVVDDGVFIFFPGAPQQM